jgi:hypothetical protein
MALDASSLLSTPQIAGVQVSPPGTYKRTVSHIGGGPDIQIGSRILGLLLRKKVAQEQAQAAESDAPPIGNRALLALTADDLALVTLDTRKRLKPVEVISRVPRTDVASTELRGGGFPGASMPLTITLKSGKHWLFEVPWLVRGRARKLTEALGV